MSVDSVWLEDDVGRIYIGRPQEEDGNLDRGDRVGVDSAAGCQSAVEETVFRMRWSRCGVFSSSGRIWDKAPSFRPGRPKVKDGGGFADAQHETGKSRGGSR